MSRKLLYILVIAAGILLAGGYLFIRYSLKREIEKDEKETGTTTPGTLMLGGKKVTIADLRPLFIKRLQLLLKKTSNGLYGLSVGDMKADILSSVVSLQHVEIKPDSVRMDSMEAMGILPQNIFIFSFEDLEIKGINFDDVINSDNMDFNAIRLTNPVIEIHRKKAPQKENEANEDFSQRFLKEIKRLAVNKLHIENGTLITYNDAQSKVAHKLSKVQINMNDILIDSTTRKNENRFLFAKEALISFKNYSLPTTGGLYNLKIDSVTIKAPQQQIELNNLSFTSPLSREQFVKKQKFSRELYHLTLPSVTIENVNWWTLLNQEELSANQLTINGGNLSIFLDRSLTPHSKMGNFPNQLLMNIPLKLNIQKLEMRDLDFSYEEYNPISKQNGKIYIDNIALQGFNISNTVIKNKKPFKVEGSGLFMHRVPIQTEFIFDMADYKSGKFSSSISGDSFEGTLINSFAMPMGLMKIEKGNIHKLKASVHGDQWKAAGDVMLLYNDLKLSLLEKDAGKKELDKKDFTSAIANLFVLKKDNPKKNEKPRVEKAAFKRIPEGGFFMLVWKTLMVGTLKTIGAPEKIASKTVSSQQK